MKWKTEPHWFRASQRYEDYGYAKAPLCRDCGMTLSHPLHRLPTRDTAGAQEWELAPDEAVDVR